MKDTFPVYFISRLHTWSYTFHLPDVVILLPSYADGTTLTLYSECDDQASDLWQQLQLASELESDLRDTVDSLLWRWTAAR